MTDPYLYMGVECAAIGHAWDITARRSPEGTPIYICQSCGLSWWETPSTAPTERLERPTAVKPTTAEKPMPVATTRVHARPTALANRPAYSFPIRWERPVVISCLTVLACFAVLLVVKTILYAQGATP